MVNLLPLSLPATKFVHGLQSGWYSITSYCRVTCFFLPLLCLNVVWLTMSVLYDVQTGATFYTPF